MDWLEDTHGFWDLPAWHRPLPWLRHAGDRVASPTGEAKGFDRQKPWRFEQKLGVLEATKCPKKRKLTMKNGELARANRI